MSREGVQADPKKVAAIEAITVDRLKTVKDLKVFMHTVGYLRRFIRNFSKVSQPLTKYLKKGRR